MDANVLAIIEILVGIGAGGIFLFLEKADLLKIPLVLGLIGLISVAAWVAVLWLIMPPLLAVSIGFVGAMWVIGVVSTRFRQRLRQLGQGWQLPIRSPRKSRLAPLPKGRFVPDAILELPEQETQRLRESLAFYENMLDTDKNKLVELVHVHQCLIVQSQLHPINGGEIDFAFEVFNGSILTVRVGENIDGRMIVAGHKLYDKADPQTPRTIPHGVANTVIIRQRILPEVAKALLDESSVQGGTEIRFDFSDIQISIDSRTPLGMNGLSCFLDIAKVFHYRLIHEPPLTGTFHRWELIAKKDIV